MMVGKKKGLCLKLAAEGGGAGSAEVVGGGRDPGGQRHEAEDPIDLAAGGTEALPT